MGGSLTPKNPVIDIFFNFKEIIFFFCMLRWGLKSGEAPDQNDFERKYKSNTSTNF
jgi:hypothetical protein